MAETIDTGVQVKLRRPWGVFFLSLITLGGFLIIPPFVSEWRYYKRIRKAQEATGTPNPISHVLGFLLYLLALILLPFETVYAQEHLNRLWRHVQSEQEKHAMGMRGEPMAPPPVR